MFRQEVFKKQMGCFKVHAFSCTGAVFSSDSRTVLAYSGALDLGRLAIEIES